VTNARIDDMTETVKAGRNGFMLGLGLGILLGLAGALVLAIYITKAPVPFLDKVPQRTAEQDAAEVEKNRNWDPNTQLHGKAASAVGMAASYVAASVASAASSVSAAASAGGWMLRAASAVSAQAGPDPFQYYIQVGAYAHNEDAEQQRAKLAMSGLTARVTEREQTGRTVYRVRIGPFEARDEAEAVRSQAAEAGYRDATLVPVPR
jgi:cell division protein FtsN